MSFQIIDNNIANPSFLEQDAHPTSKVVQVRRELTTDVYVFFIEASNQNLVYRKSTDGGTTYGAQVLIKTGTGFNHLNVCVWYDRWTPGDSGTVIHILDFIGGGSSGVTRYFGLDTATDTFVANNDVQIPAAGGDLGSSRAATSICKATNGELFTTWVVNTSTATVSFRSVDSGATWAQLTGTAIDTGTNFRDKMLCLPLADTGSDVADILYIRMSRSFNRVEYFIFHNQTDTFDPAVTVLENGPTNPNSGTHVNAATLDPTTGDVYFVYNDDDIGVNSDNNLIFRKFTNSTRTWGPKINVSAPSNNTTIVTLNENLGPAICREPTNGILLVSAMIGDASSTVPGFLLSSDEGETWSDPFFVPGLGDRDLRKTNLPAVMVDTNDGWYATFIDWGNLNLLGWVGEQALEFYSGTVTKRANGPSTPPPVENATVVVEQTTPRQICGRNFGMNRPRHGAAISDSNGDYKCAVWPLWPNETGGPINYQALGYKQGATDAGDLMDLSREDAEDP